MAPCPSTPAARRESVASMPRSDRPWTAARSGCERVSRRAMCVEPGQLGLAVRDLLRADPADDLGAGALTGLDDLCALARALHRAFALDAFIPQLEQDFAALVGGRGARPQLLE